MALPVVRHHDARQIGMVAKADTEEIESFALVPIGPAIDAHGRIDFRIFVRYSRLDAKPLFARDGLQMVDHFKAGFGGESIDRRY